MPLKRSTAIQAQLQKITPETTIEFLVTKIEIVLCLFGVKFIYSFECILKLRKKTNCFAGKLGKQYICLHYNEVIRIFFKLLRRITIYPVAMGVSLNVKLSMKKVTENNKQKL